MICSPARTGSGASVLTMNRSANACEPVESVEELLPSSGSLVVLDTTAVLTAGFVSVGSGSMATVTSTDEDVSAASGPASRQVNSGPTAPQVQGPGSGEKPAYARPVGSVSVISTFWASDDPKLSTVSRYVP